MFIRCSVFRNGLCIKYHLPAEGAFTAVIKCRDRSVTDENGNKLLDLEKSDLNFDGSVDIGDAVLAERACRGVITDPFEGMKQSNPADYPDTEKTPPFSGEYVAGDIDGSGTITVTDISMVAAQVKGIDVNGDGQINVSDISMIAAHVKGVKKLK